ncbi:hypothetical protein [Terrabacter sp. NPDC000476]|uniref:hypothetical protein n=1 Tax=Terrabacter sp. NPDC000476 TaxID=3154258 RepID=UPI00331C577E
MRRTLDKVISWTGLAMAAVLFVAGALLIYASSFVASNVEEQLRPQNITMPSGAALTTQAMKDNLGPYAGQPMTNGNQAKAFADHYIWEHMVEASGGQSYSEVSGKYVALSKDPNADPAELQKLGDLRNTLFMGNTLRGLLLEAYAFGTMGTIALWAGVAALVAGAVMLGLGLLGLRHARTAVDTYESRTQSNP